MVPSERAQVALVLAGGAARGAYEVGVVQYLLDELPRTLGRTPPLDILCGTSVGAINACHLAATADDNRGRALRLSRSWEALRVRHVIRPDTVEMFNLVRSMFGRNAPWAARRGGMIDPTGLERIVAASIAFPRIADNLKNGHVKAVSVSTTHVSSGRTVVWVQREGGGLPRFGNDPTVVPRATELTVAHALASAAIPLIFPAVPLEGEWHCDGGLRQNVPLSPARRLGADGMIIVSPRYQPPNPDPDVPPRGTAAEDYPSPLTLIGKTLNALLLDRLDADIDRLQRITALLDAGAEAYGPGFVDRVNAIMGADRHHRLKPLRTVLIRASVDIGELAGDFVRSPAFNSRADGMVLRVLRRLAGKAQNDESDLLSYLLFDGEFARTLMELGRQDARRKHDELIAFFEQMDLTEHSRDADEPAA